MMPPPPIGPDGQILHHGHGPPMVLHPGHLMSPPHPHVISPFQRTGTLPHNFSMGTLPHQHPRSVSCDHSNAGAGYGPIIQTTQGARPGYVTLPRRPRGSWAGHQPRDTPSPALSVSMSGTRDPIYDGVGPRTSATGSSVTNLNKSVDNAIIPAFKGSVGSRYQPTLPPLIPPIKEEAGHLHQPGLPKSNPNILNMSEVKQQTFCFRSSQPSFYCCDITRPDCGCKLKISSVSPRFDRGKCRDVNKIKTFCPPRVFTNSQFSAKFCHRSQHQEKPTVPPPDLWQRLHSQWGRRGGESQRLL